MRISFGEYCLNLAKRQLLRGSDEVRLSPKAFELLSVLIENRARAMSKAELHEHLWHDTYVTDANLSVLIAELRHALDDHPARPAFIRTVRGFGYTFCATASADRGPSTSSRTCWIVFNQQEIALRDGDNIIGRDASAAVRLDRPSVSRQHARINVSAGGAVIEDLGSKNGTYLRNSRISGAVPLQDLDEVQVGSARLLVRILSGNEATETLAS